MITVIQQSEKNKVPIFLWTDTIEDGALEQAINLSNLPFIYRHIAIMPDVHQGYGMPIGGVIATQNVIIPNAVGSDIGCGMVAVKTNISSDSITKEQIKNIFIEIKKCIPVGFSVHKDNQIWTGFDNYKTMFKYDYIPGWVDVKKWERIQKSLGTLGSGNHFAEIQRGDDGFIWLMLHSGSRILGKYIADYHHKKALELNEKWYSNIPHKDLAFLPTDTLNGDNYIKDMVFALAFAKENRYRMMEKFKYIFASVMKIAKFEEEINIHHNYATVEHHFKKNVWVHRKGATSAKKGQKGIIPGSMGASSYIVEGLGNPLSFQSCSHGAGRKMGRIEASKKLDVNKCTKDMEGIVFDGWGKGRKTEYDLGEAPEAYKDIDEVMKNQKDLVKILVKLMPLGVLKRKTNV